MTLESTEKVTWMSNQLFFLNVSICFVKELQNELVNLFINADFISQFIIEHKRLYVDACDSSGPP